MNSRDAAYDDEQLRRAIEASKEDAPLDLLDGSIRRTKRGRSDSEELVPIVYNEGSTDELTMVRNHSHVKRQRTNSRSASPPGGAIEAPSHDNSEDEANTRNGYKKPRNAKNQPEKVEKEERERQRQEAANKRKGRAERRRADGMTSESYASPAKELTL